MQFDFNTAFADFAVIAPREIKFNINGTDHVLREATAGDAAAAKNERARAARWSSEGEFAGVETVADANLLLVGLCLFTAAEHAKGDAARPVGVEVVRKLPERLQSLMLRWVEENSDLDNDDPVVIRKQIAALEKQLRKIEGHAPKALSPSA